MYFCSSRCLWWLPCLRQGCPGLSSVALLAEGSPTPAHQLLQAEECGRIEVLGPPPGRQEACHGSRAGTCGSDIFTHLLFNPSICRSEVCVNACLIPTVRALRAPAGCNDADHPHLGFPSPQLPAHGPRSLIYTQNCSVGSSMVMQTW